MNVKSVHIRCAFAAGILVTVSNVNGQVRYVDVDATGSNNGTSWSNAWTDFQDAIAFAHANPNSISEIWVAEGTYLPDGASVGNRNLSFTFDAINSPVLETPLGIYGGFDGTETSRDERQPGVHITILSGDLDADDGASFANRSDNSYNVIEILAVDNGLIIDGFTIRGGNADNISDDSGGGIYMTSGSLILGPRFVNCIIKDNEADIEGGGIASNFVQIDLRNSRVENNRAPRGGGISAFGCFLRNSTIQNNVAEDEGGGIEGSNILMLNCRVVNNEVNAGVGGGIHAHGCDLRSSFISGNIASCDGGGLYLASGAALVTNCVFIDNEAEGTGECDGVGGGLWLCDPNGEIINSTVAANIAADSNGGGLYWVENQGLPTLELFVSNSIFWDNVGNSTQAEVAQIFGTTNVHDFTIEYSVIENLSMWGGTGNDDDDPLFVSVGSLNVRLQSGSPYIDDGNDSDVPTDCMGLEDPSLDCDVDEDGCESEPMPDEDQGPRILGNAVDRGAYEFMSLDCPADFTDSEGGAPDGVVDVSDLFLLLSLWNQPPPVSSAACSDPSIIYPGALAPDRHNVDVNDLFLLLAAFGECEDPVGVEAELGDCLDHLPNIEAVIECLGLE